MLTRERNLVWTNDLTLWGDTASKSPNSWRAQMNYGLALMSRGRMAEAEARYRDALRLAPNYTYIHTNLAIVLDSRGDLAGAAASHDRAVACAPRDATPYYWRGTFRARHGDYPNAIADFEKAASMNPSPLRELAALAECHLRMGRPDLAERALEQGRRLDATGLETERAGFRRAYLGGR
jgi:Flp pilus assembly protein TadD